MTQKVIPQGVAIAGIIACWLFLAVTAWWILGWWRTTALAAMYVVWAVGAHVLVRYLERRGGIDGRG